ncbi:hypothetical protein [Bradyrhizobium sp. RD5-C2]|uniref:hypothetical protein n=1 Tax=Bradyrhizobium sp. RD5-C2 TaxID=244562 RepID=UPI001CC700BB|nr:hypothetical protein [Bradyrhizobium sp. RD5-C2]GIQ75961.1 hypothetical protein BraRD5C2_44040 [Bradyrhizobium sp. RD5-C2]
MAECIGTGWWAIVQWVAPIISSFFPWPALILAILVSPPVRRSLSNFAIAFAELPRAVTAIKMAGLKINLDPGKAKELLSITSEVVYADFERVIDREVEKQKIWSKFEQVIEKGLRPFIHTEVPRPDAESPFPFRVTLHMPDTLEPETLYQLIDYYPAGPFPNSKGRRKSIRFGAIGKAWRLESSDYSPAVSTQRNDLIKDWGMTAKEAEAAGQGRQTFLSVILRDSSRVPLAIFYMDAYPKGFLDQHSVQEIAGAIEKAAGTAKLTSALVNVRTKMVDQAARPKVS